MTARVSEKNPLVVAGVAVVAVVAVLAVTMNLRAFAFWNGTDDHAAYLTNASGLAVGDSVQVRGVRVGEVKKMTIEGDEVRVDFDVDSDVRLGTDTEAAVKVLNPLGTVYLGIEPGGSGALSEAIPTSRTTVSMSLLGDLGQVSKQVDAINLEQLQKALDVTTTNLSATSAQAIEKALTGLTKFSGTLAENSDELHQIVTQGSDIAGILDDRKEELVNLIGQGEALMAVLKERQGDIQRLLRGTSALSREVSAILKVNEKALNPMLRDLETISDVLARENDSISKAMPALARLSADTAAVTGNGPFLDVVIPNGLLPDAVIGDCTDSAYPKPSNPIVGCRP